MIAGHGRLLAARKLGIAEVPVIELAHLTPAQKRAYIIADNRLALDAGWDDEMLALDLAELSEAGFDLALTGFDDGEIERLLETIDGTEQAAGDNDGEPHGDIDDDDAAPAGPVISRPGDVWILGEHRLACGDASDPGVVASLMGGETSHLLFTSPPYANKRDYTTGGIADWDVLMQGVFSAAQTAMREDAQILVNLGLVHRDNEWHPYWDGWIEWMRAQGWRRFGWYVWDQSAPVPGDWVGRLAPRHEFVFHFNRRSRKPNKIVPCKSAGSYRHIRADGSATAMRAKDGTVLKLNHTGRPVQDFRIPDSVVEVTRQRGRIGDGIDHPAVFPVGLPKFFIEAYTDTGETVFEPFSGSGTTILAGQITGRRVRAIELAPEYVDVALRRWMRHNPDSVPVLQQSGMAFDDVAAERSANTW